MREPLWSRKTWEQAALPPAWWEKATASPARGAPRARCGGAIRVRRPAGLGSTTGVERFDRAALAHMVLLEHGAPPAISSGESRMCALRYGHVDGLGLAMRPTSAVHVLPQVGVP